MSEKKKRPQSLGEEIGNAITHGVGAIFAIIALILMLTKQTTGVGLAGSLVFGISMFFIYLSSCLYHCFKHGSKVKALFRIFDHSSIFILIAGTYTPILLSGVLGGTLGWVYFGIQWGIVVLAILVRIFFPKKNGILRVVLSLILGWSGLSIIPNMYHYSLPFFWLILAGGLAYSAGIAFYISRFKYSHFVWHFFVLGGTICHFIAIYLYLL